MRFNLRAEVAQLSPLELLEFSFSPSFVYILNIINPYWDWNLKPQFEIITILKYSKWG